MSDDLVKQLQTPRPMSMFLTRADQAKDWTELLHTAADRIEQLAATNEELTNCVAVLEAKHQETFQMYVDANEARIDAEAKLAQVQRTLDWTEDRAKDYREGREMMGHKWAKAEEGRRKAIEAMERAVFLWEQPHYGDNDTIIDHGSEAIDMLRTTLAELKGQNNE